MNEISPEYVAARRVLLEALEALAPHLDNLILIGAQAVYIHTGDAELNVPPMTTDADLALDTSALAATPEIGAALRLAGFAAPDQPGHWVGPGDVGLDLMVVTHQAGTAKKGARAARVARHDPLTARITAGLEAILVDNQSTTITAFESDDDRSFVIRVGGPAALLTAKAFKVAERLHEAETRPDRVIEKDALDMFRILQAVASGDLADGFRRHSSDEHARPESQRALGLLGEHGASSAGSYAQLAQSAAQGDPTVPPAFAALVRGLLTALASE